MYYGKLFEHGQLNLALDSSNAVAVLVVIQSLIFHRRSRGAGELVGLREEEARRAFRIGAVSAIGPAFGVFVVMLGLMAAIGGPFA